jgi:hypothetical protein
MSFQCNVDDIKKQAIALRAGTSKKQKSEQSGFAEQPGNLGWH